MTRKKDSIPPPELEQQIFWRTQYAYPEHDEIVGAQTALYCRPEEDQTVQSFAEELNINSMMRRFGITGQLPIRRGEPMYGDFSMMGDYQGAFNTVQEAREQFNALPANIRDRFSNDPNELLWFIRDPSNAEEAAELGLIPKKEPKREAAPPPETTPAEK